MTPLHLFTAIALVLLAGVLIVWFYREQMAASGWRRTRMLNRVGLAPDMGDHGGIRTRLMNDARRRCNRCPSEALCERWLEGDVDGDNRFCPNARTFETLRQQKRLAA